MSIREYEDAYAVSVAPGGDKLRLLLELDQGERRAPERIASSLERIVRVLEAKR